MSDLTVVNKGEVLTFPSFATTKPTQKRPDIVLVSCEAGVVIIVELSAGWDGNQTDQHARKQKKYHLEFDDGVKEAGWELHVFCVEVGCRGLISGSFREAMRKIGLAPGVIKKLVAEVAGIARLCSWCIILYSHREQPSFVYNAVHAHPEHGAEWKVLEKELKAQVFEVGADLVTACGPVRVVGRRRRVPSEAKASADDGTRDVAPSGAEGAWAWARGPTVSSMSAQTMLLDHGETVLSASERLRARAHGAYDVEMAMCEVEQRLALARVMLSSPHINMSPDIAWLVAQACDECDGKSTNLELGSFSVTYRWCRVRAMALWCNTKQLRLQNTDKPVERRVRWDVRPSTHTDQDGSMVPRA